MGAFIAHGVILSGIIKCAIELRVLMKFHFFLLFGRSFGFFI